MKGKISLITILTNDVESMLKFYNKVLGFNISMESGEYVELENEGVRFAICSRRVMFNFTNYQQFEDIPTGQRFELAFPLASKTEVDSTYSEIIKNGAVPIKAPSDMPWGQRTAFFADPDGNVHELFAD
jgi:lactoylglutathione lyase